MKYVVVLADGMAGEPLEELGQKTTLEAAETPEMDRLAGLSEIGAVCMVPEEMAPGSDTANLSVLGYDPRACYTGRSPLEALSIGVKLQERDVAFRCNLVTLSEEEDCYRERRMLDHGAGEITTEEAGALLTAVADAFRDQHIISGAQHFYTGTGYRHLFTETGGKVQELVAPHDILGNRIGVYLPQDEALRRMMEKSYEILKANPVNRERQKKGLHPANSIWFWGAGTRPKLENFEKKTGKKGVMVSAVDLLKGIAAGAGMKRILVEGADGGLDTNYAGKADAAVSALLDEGYDFAYVHIEAPDEMGHQGRIQDKIRSIERIDREVLSRITQALDQSGEAYRLLVLPDHSTPVRVRTHTKDPVPYLLYDSRRRQPGAEAYNEKNAAETGRVWKKDGFRLLEHLLND